jgi:ABC-type branched-subunit amino acid transport system substrate-binding protein
MAGETILIPKEKTALVEPLPSATPEISVEPDQAEQPAAQSPVRIVAWERPENCKPDPMAARQKYDVALLLPLYISANDSINLVHMTKDEMMQDSAFMEKFGAVEDLPEDTLIVREEPVVYPRSENFIHFYEGVLMAVDSLKRAGMNIELHVFDTNQEQAVVNRLVHLDVFRELDLIIGPVYPELQGPVANFAFKNRIPMVSPLSSAGNFEEQNPWYFKVNPTKEYLLRETARFISEEYFNQNLVVLQMGNYKHLPEAVLVDLCREKFFSARYQETGTDIHFHEYNFPAEGYSGLSRILSKNRQNVFIIPSDTEAQVSVAVSNINTLAEKYPVTLIGSSNFQRFRSIQPEYFHQVNMQLLSPYFVDYRSKLTNRFISGFRDNFATEPNQFSFQGYDVAFYFMSALFQYGKDFVDCLPTHHVPLIQSEFFFDKVSRHGGYMNRGLFVVKHKPNYEVVAEGLRGIPSLLLGDQ